MTGKVVSINTSVGKSVLEKSIDNAIEKIKGNTSDCGSINYQ